MTLSHVEKNLYYRCYAAIDLSAITHNVSRLKTCMGEGIMAMAVVKADAYGHGSITVSKHIEKDVDYFAVASLDEAIVLREGGISKPILILSYTSPLLFDELIDNDITATIYNVDEAKQLSEAAIAKGKKAKVHIAIDTGMGRIGFTPDAESADCVKEISQLAGITLEGLFSHYACADCLDKTDAQEQTRLFDAFIAMLEERGVNIPIKHICNSAGTIDFTKQYNMCRLGIALYGLEPSNEVDIHKLGLTPAMEVVSHVVHIKDVPKGFKIGYGHIYETPVPRKIATVSIGYADGFNRCLTGVGYVLINGKKAPIVGKVCMDQIMVDVTDIEDVSIGMHAIILGENQDAHITAEEFGAMCHSFNYEVVCTFMPRVKRVYYENGKIMNP
ncbi:MAG: alanine racemase [Ruminococcaceae bacterium]|nr:alanine racemase [Oscillospiraceae bacterium]